MKNLIALIVIGLLMLSFKATAQNAKQDASGNYIAIAATRTDTATNKPTGKTFTDTKGNKYPVMISSKGKLFYVRTSGRTGNPYKVYIKL